MPPTEVPTNWQQDSGGARHCDFRLVINQDGTYSLRDLQGEKQPTEFKSEDDTMVAFAAILSQGKSQIS